MRPARILAVVVVIPVVVFFVDQIARVAGLRGAGAAVRLAVENLIGVGSGGGFSDGMRRSRRDAVDGDGVR